MLDKRILSWCFMMYLIEQDTILTVLINFEFWIYYCVLNDDDDK